MSPRSQTALALALAAAVTLLAGCTTNAPWSSSTPGTSSTGAPVGGMCSGPPAQMVVGKNSTAKVVEEARVRSGAQMARVLRPDQIVTKEFDATRLNLQVDANGRIVAARCG